MGEAPEFKKKSELTELGEPRRGCHAACQRRRRGSPNAVGRMLKRRDEHTAGLQQVSRLAALE